jgi:hypothetical protein
MALGLIKAQAHRMDFKRMPHNQVVLQAPTRCPVVPRMGWGLLGAEIWGVGSGRLGTLPNGASDHPDQVRPQTRHVLHRGAIYRGQVFRRD